MSESPKIFIEESFHKWALEQWKLAYPRVPEDEIGRFYKKLQQAEQKVASLQVPAYPPILRSLEN